MCDLHIRIGENFNRVDFIAIRAINKFLVIFSIFLTLLSLQNSTFAAAPLPNCPVTSPYGPRHIKAGAGPIHKGVDLGLDSGTPIIAPADGIVNHGAGNGFIYYVGIQCGNIYYLFGDCNPDTLSCPTGSVKEGTIIGYTGGDAYDGPLGKSTGPHCHVEVHPNGQGSAAVNPVPYLQALGMKLTGNLGSYYGTGTDSSINWGVKTMYEFASSLSKIMKEVTAAANKAYTPLQAAAWGLLGCLCVIDFCWPILINMHITGSYIAEKAIKYGFLIFLVANWGHLVNDFFLNIVSSVSGTFSGNSAIIAKNVPQPELLFQKCVYMINPALNKISSYGVLGFMSNITTIFPVMVMTIITMAVYFLFALYIALSYCEFYIAAAFAVFTLPFKATNFSRFIGDGSLGGVISATLKLLILSVFVALCVTCLKDAKAPDIFDVHTAATVNSGNGVVSGPADLVALATEKAQKYHIPVNLFLAQIQSESSWNPHAVSSSGAEGLGQLEPRTAAGLGCSDPFDPEQNLEASAKYMSNLYAMFHDWNLALAAYNGGHARLSKYMSEHGGQLPRWATDYINLVHKNLSGSYFANNGISAAAMAKYVKLCLCLIALAAIAMICTKSIMKGLGGQFEN